MGEIRERPEIQVIGHRVLCESQIAAGTTGHPQDTTQSFNCPPKVEKSIRPSMCLRYWGLDHPRTHFKTFYVKWNCPTHPRNPWIRKLLSFRELKVQFGVFYEIFIFLFNYKFLLHR